MEENNCCTLVKQENTNKVEHIDPDDLHFSIAFFGFLLCILLTLTLSIGYSKGGRPDLS